MPYHFCLPFFLAALVMVHSPYSEASAPKVPSPLVVISEAPPVESITVTNNHSFPVHELFSIPVKAASEDETWQVEESRSGVVTKTAPLQLYRDGNRIFGWIEPDLEGNESTKYIFRATESKPTIDSIDVTEGETFPSGLPKVFRIGDNMQLPAFDLQLVETKSQLNRFHRSREGKVRAALSESADSAPLSFRRTAMHAGPSLTEYHYEAEGGRFNDYSINVIHRVRSDGTIDTEIKVGTRGIRTPKTYLAIAKLLPNTSRDSVIVDWKGEKYELPSQGASPRRALRTHNWGRDVNWIALGSGTNGLLTRPLIAAYTPNLARVHRETLRNANDFLVNEYVVGTSDGWAVLAEIAREQLVLKNYVAKNFVPPAEHETITLRYRTLPPGEYSPDQIDAALISFAGYQGTRITAPGEIAVDIGVPGVSFGTNYFPNATFGENFEFWRAGGLAGGRLGRDLNYWWPAFRHWNLFKDDIRRDLRIINSLGIEWFRIHDNPVPDYRQDYLQTPEGAWMFEYLKFMADTARECDLGILLDFNISPGDAAYVARHLGDVIQFYEIDNEVLLIPGARVEYFDYWREVRERILQERPGAPVFVTGAAAQPFAMHEEFDRRELAFDAIGQHGYVDKRETPSHFRDNAISFGGFATRRGQLPINTEYNWRMITRETESQQAQHFEELSDYYLSPRAMPVAFQFQFQETFCVPPRMRGALRHYEPLRLDRTPKPQAIVFKDSIRKFGNADNRLRQLDIKMNDDVHLTPGEAFTYQVTIENHATQPLSLQLTSCLPAGFTEAGDALIIDVRPGEKRVVTRQARAPAKLQPGVYHFFEEARYNGGSVLFGWGIARHIARPQLDLERSVLKGVRYEGGLEMLGKIDLSSITSSVFGEDAPALEVDWALYIYHSLRASTGKPVTRETDTTLSIADGARKNLVVVGTPTSNKLIQSISDRLPSSFSELSPGTGLITQLDAPLGNEGVTWLVVTGADAEGVERAASDLLYRYWRFAKDAATFRSDMPPAEGSWMTGEPEREPPSARASDKRAMLQSITVQVPETIRVGESFRIVAISSAEPPGPAAGVRVSVLNGRERVQSGVSNAAGEVVFQLDDPGVYKVRVDRAPDSVTNITVQQ